jgi:hypothetical protein
MKITLSSSAETLNQVRMLRRHHVRNHRRVDLTVMNAGW